MRIITISREFGSGGREPGKRLADILGFDYYDSEIISAVAQNSGLDIHYVENKLTGHGWQSFPITFSRTIGSVGYIQSSKANLLLEQKKVIERIASLGRNCVIVGRNADVILKRHRPFNCHRHESDGWRRHPSFLFFQKEQQYSPARKDKI